MSQAAKSAVVTGAGSGFGKHLAERLASEGYCVTVADVNQPAADAVVKEICAAGGRAQAVRCDVAQHKEQTAMFAAHADAYGSLDVAILNAGILERGHLLDDDISQYDHYMGIAMMGVIYGTQLASQTMSRLGSKGIILVTSSTVALDPSITTYPCYATAKLGMLGLMRNCVPKLKEKGQRMGAVCPTLVNTGLIYQNGLITGERFAELKDFPAELMCPISLVGDAFMHLIDDKESTGTILRVEGGLPGDKTRPFMIEEVKLEVSVVKVIKKSTVTRGDVLVSEQ